MNNNELITEISRRSGLSIADCDKVMKTFEEVVTEGLSDKRWKGRTFDFILRLMNSVRANK